MLSLLEVALLNIVYISFYNISTPKTWIVTDVSYNFVKMKARSETLHFKTFFKFFEIYKHGRSMTVNLTEKNQ